MTNPWWNSKPQQDKSVTGDMRKLFESCTDGESYPDYMILGVVPKHWTCKEPIEITKAGAYQAGRPLTEQEYADIAKMMGW